MLAMGGSGGSFRDPAAAQWRQALRQEAQALWIQRDARRDDWVQPLAPLEAVVNDGLLMAHVAVRMSLKNRIIVATLRDRLAFDREGFEELARTELLRLAAESEQTADRLEPIVSALPSADRRSLAEQLEREDQVRRPVVHRALAAALRDAATEPALLEAMVQQAEADAADEVGQAEAAPRDPVRDADYEARRDRRVRALIDKDLRALQRDPDARPQPRRDRWATTRPRP